MKRLSGNRYTRLKDCNAIEKSNVAKKNEDPQFLRARFRKTILPLLSTHFGKDIFGCLKRIGRDSAELAQYLNEQVKPYLEKIVFSPFGLSLDLSQKRPTSPFEFKHLLRQFCEIGNISLSRPMLDKLVEMLESGVANKEIRTKQADLQIDRHHLFLIQKSIHPAESELSVTPGIYAYGIWNIDIKIVDYSPELSTTSWIDAWKGKAHVVLPEGEYRLVPIKDNQLSKWWNNGKVPAFLRDLLPVVSNDGNIAHEFLTGRRKQLSQPGPKALSITLMVDNEIIPQPART